MNFIIVNKFGSRPNERNFLLRHGIDTVVSVGGFTRNERNGVVPVGYDAYDIVFAGICVRAVDSYRVYVFVTVYDRAESNFVTNFGGRSVNGIYIVYRYGKRSLAYHEHFGVYDFVASYLCGNGVSSCRNNAVDFDSVFRNRNDDFVYDFVSVGNFCGNVEYGSRTVVSLAVFAHAEIYGVVSVRFDYVKFVFFARYFVVSVVGNGFYFVSSDGKGLPLFKRNFSVRRYGSYFDSVFRDYKGISSQIVFAYGGEQNSRSFVLAYVVMVGYSYGNGLFGDSIRKSRVL